MNVLVADDDAISRRVLVLALGRIGHQAITVEDGTQALEVLTAPDGPRLALLDWHMPGLDGIDVCRRVRARTDLPFVYLILVTGRSGAEDVAAALEAGADDFIMKPCEPTALHARVRIGERILALQLENERLTAKLRALLGPM